MIDVSARNQTLPFLKWVGGKRWLAGRHPWLFPEKINRYLEPFLGGAAVFFYLQPERARLSDMNAELIATYSAIKKDWRNVVRLLSSHQRRHSEDHYYSIRERPSSDPTREAARFIYLNRSCFNGIYRVNLKGVFNVPKGSKDTILFPNDDFEAVAKCLRKSTLLVRDFEEALADAKAGDFAFVDPPYTVKHNNNGFVKYNQKLFSWNDQLRLRAAVENATRRGARILLTNADHYSVRDLYKGLGQIHELQRASIVSGSAAHRRGSTELAITVGYGVKRSGLQTTPMVRQHSGADQGH